MLRTLKGGGNLAFIRRNDMLGPRVSQPCPFKKPQPLEYIKQHGIANCDYSAPIHHIVVLFDHGLLTGGQFGVRHNDDVE